MEGAMGHLIDEIRKSTPLLPTYLHLLISAVFPILIAAHASLRRPPSAAPAKKAKARKTRKAPHDDSDDEEESSSPLETLTTSDAILFPVLAGATLTGLYLIIKWLEDPAILNKILGYYFNWVGAFFTFNFSKDVLGVFRSLVFPTQFSSGGKLYKYDQKKNCFELTDKDGTTHQISTSGIFGRATRGPTLLHSLRKTLYYKVSCSITMRKPFAQAKTAFSITPIDGLAAVTAMVIGLSSTLLGKTPWYLTNLQGFAFCYGSLQFMTPGTAAVGSLLLSLLFFYDIYMVFYTPMMVTVATKLEVPIKLLFPRPDDGSCPKPLGALPGSEEMEEYLKCLAEKRTMAMLGLGDIVVPGIMIAYALRFDLYRYYLKMKQTAGKSEKDENDATESKEDTRPTYVPARGMWVERFYTARKLWSPVLRAKSFPKPYFTAALVGYVLGLIATLLVMQVYKHAQPALLYLVPGVLTSFWGLALCKREVKMLWNYDEAEEEKEAEKKKEEAKSPGKESKEKQKDKGRDSGEEAKSDNTSNTSAYNEDEAPRPAFSLDIYLPVTARTLSTADKVAVGGCSKGAPLTPARANIEATDQIAESEGSEPSTIPSSSTSSTPEIISAAEVTEDDYDAESTDVQGDD